MNKRKITFKEYSGRVSIRTKDIHRALKDNRFSNFINKALKKYISCYRNYNLILGERSSGKKYMIDKMKHK